MTTDGTATLTFDRSSRSRLTHRDAARFPGEALFDRVARVVAGAECLPRKELYEAWEVARRVRRRERGGRVIDLACGHGLVGHLMLLLDDTSPTAIGVDHRVPLSAGRLASALVVAWPRLAARVSVIQARAEDCPLTAEDLVVAVHACGELTDAILDRVIAARARVAFMACCHDAAACDLGGLGGWLEPSIAIDATRVARLRASGYDVSTQTIPADITPENRLVIARPSADPAPPG